MGQQRRVPRGALVGYVSSMVAYSHEGFPAGEHVGMPSGSVTVLLPLDPLLHLRGVAGDRRVMRSCLGGIHAEPLTIVHNGVQRGIQVGLHPLGLARLLGVRAVDVSGLTVELADVVGDRRCAHLLDQLGDARGLDAQLDVVERTLLDWMRVGIDRPIRYEVGHAWRLLERSGGTLSINEVAQRVGWSTRYLTREFTRVLGHGPKGMARILRFERTVDPVSRGRPLADVAAYCGYADQAHLTREWNRLAGTPPSRWRHTDVLANLPDAAATSAV